MSNATRLDFQRGVRSSLDEKSVLAIDVARVSWRTISLDGEQNIRVIYNIRHDIGSSSACRIKLAERLLIGVRICVRTTKEDTDDIDFSRIIASGGLLFDCSGCAVNQMNDIPCCNRSAVARSNRVLAESLKRTAVKTTNRAQTEGERLLKTCVSPSNQNHLTMVSAPVWVTCKRCFSRALWIQNGHAWIRLTEITIINSILLILVHLLVRVSS